LPEMILAANWKMHHTLDKARGFVRELLQQLAELRKPGEPSVVIFPAFPHLAAVAEEAEGTRIQIGAQDCYIREEGAFTGEVSPTQIADTGASCVLVGHSERRHILGDSDELVAQKLTAAIAHGLRAFLCVGETEDERASESSRSVVEAQLESALTASDEITAGNLVIAYEPVWAIGTGRHATVADAEEMTAVIRAKLIQRLGAQSGQEIPILYGGSVKPGLLAGYLASGLIQGALVGGASLKASSFASLYGEMKTAAQGAGSGQ